MPCDAGPDPLGDSADPRRYVPLDTHEHVLGVLISSIRDGRTPALLEGPGGAGKTLLLRVLADRVREHGHASVFSPFLQLAPDEVTRWLLPLIAEPLSAPAAPLPAGAPPDPSRAIVVIVDEIQSAPETSVQRLADLAREAGAKLAIVVGGTPGQLLDALKPALGAETTVSLPEALPTSEVQLLCDAILQDPSIEPKLRELTRRERDALLQAANGVPALLKNALTRRAVCLAVAAPLSDLDAAPEPTSTLEQAIEVEQWPSLDPDEFRSQPEPKRPVPRPLALDQCMDETIDLAVWSADRETKRDRVTRVRSREPDVPRSAAARARTVSWSSSTRARVASLWIAIAWACARLSQALHWSVAAPIHLAVASWRRAQVACGKAAAASTLAIRRRIESGRHGLRAQTSAWSARTARARAGLGMAASASHAAVGRVASGAISGARATARMSAERTGAGFARARRVGGAGVGAVLSSIDRSRHALRAWFVYVATASADLARAMRGPRSISILAAALVVVAAVAVVWLNPNPTGSTAQPQVASAPPPQALVSPTPAMPSERSSVDEAPTVDPEDLLRVHVNSRPWALIRVDGTDAGATPLSHLRLAPGPHDFEASYPDGRVVARRVEIGPVTRFVAFP